MEIVVKSIEELKNWVGNFADGLEKNNQATVVTLSGDLGAGKTTMVQQIAQHLGVQEEVTSPTFVIQKEYEVDDHDWIKKLVHIDAYRLEGKQELEYLGFNELLGDPGNLIFVEWPEMVAGIHFNDPIEVQISINPDHSRNIIIQKPGT